MNDFFCYSKFFFVVLLAVSLLSLKVNCQEPLLLDLPTSLSQALNCNRQLLGSLDQLTYSRYNVELVENEFNVKIIPSGRAGYVGGGKVGTGMSVGGGIDINKKFQSGTSISIGPTILRSVDHYVSEVRAKVSQPLLRGLGSEYQLASLLSAKFGLRSAYRSLYLAQVHLVVRTIQALYEVTKAEKNLSLVHESHQRILRFYQSAKMKERIGLSDAMDVYRAELELRHAVDALAGAEERFQESEDFLRELLALPLNTPIKVDVPLHYTPNDVGLEEAIQLALDNRVEIEQSEDERCERLRMAKISKKNLLPELNLVFEYANAGRDEVFTRTWACKRRSTWGVGFTTSTDFNAAGEQIIYEQSLLEAEAALRGIDQARALIVLEVKKSMRHLHHSLERITLQEEQIKTSKGELALARIKFDRGMADNFNVIQAEKSLQNAEQAYWSALVDHIVGEFQLLAAVGLLMDKPCIPCRTAFAM
jgi:outer membrane protein TolC